MDSKPSAPYMVAAKSYDSDTGTLALRLVDGTEYLVTNAGHARTVLERVEPAAEVSADLRHWLERYRVGQGPKDTTRLVARLGMLRVELKSKR